jgi:hypothetical protein
MAHLTSSEISHYQNQGFVVPQFRLSQRRIEQLQLTLNELIRNNPDVNEGVARITGKA